MSSESDYGDSALEDLKGLDLLAALQIPLQPLVYDPATQNCKSLIVTHQLVSVLIMTQRVDYITL
jgi:hypothetical protein